MFFGSRHLDQQQQQQQPQVATHPHWVERNQKSSHGMKGGLDRAPSKKEKLYNISRIRTYIHKEYILLLDGAVYTSTRRKKTKRGYLNRPQNKRETDEGKRRTNTTRRERAKIVRCQHLGKVRAFGTTYERGKWVAVDVCASGPPSLTMETLTRRRPIPNRFLRRRELRRRLRHSSTKTKLNKSPICFWLYVIWQTHSDKPKPKPRKPN